jgi:Carboxypeptidase regulatory-like domain
MRAGIVSALAAILWIPFPAPAQEATASLTGAVIDQTGAYVARAAVELDSGTKKYQVQADDAGVYQFSNLPAGKYTLKFQVPGFESLTLKSIGLSEREKKRIPDATLLAGGVNCGGPRRDFLQLLPETSFGGLSGNVLPPMADVEVTLVCRTFSVCRSTKTNSSGRFSFDTLSAGVYGINFRHDSFYPVIATGYSYYVDAGWESVYDPKVLQQCPNGNCDPKLRPPGQPTVCE